MKFSVTWGEKGSNAETEPSSFHKNPILFCWWVLQVVTRAQRCWEQLDQDPRSFSQAMQPSRKELGTFALQIGDLHLDTQLNVLLKM